MKILCLFILLITNIELIAQTSETIKSDRPGQANTPFTVGKSMFQVQSGLGYYANHHFPSLTYESFNAAGMIRYGISNKLELGLNSFYSKTTFENDSSRNTGTYLAKPTFSLRANLFESDNWIPSLGCLISVVPFNLASPEFGTQFTVMTTQSLGNKWGFSTNLGFEYQSPSNSNAFNFVINLSRSFGDRLSAFAEYYGTRQKSLYNDAFDGGLSFLVNNNFQLDLYVGFPNSIQITNAWFTNVGFSWRVPTKGENNSASML